MPDKKYKDRTIQLITHSDSQKSKLEKLAHKNGSPLSKYLLNLIESAAADEERPIRLEDSSKLLEEIDILKEDLRIKSLLLERYESDMRRHQSASFIEPGFRGIRHIDVKLICAIKAGPIGDYKLLDLLQIDRNDTDMIQAVSRQLEALESYGLIGKGEGGWRWKK
jgi:hypothetical protein